MTGVRYVIAIRAASIAASKQCDEERAATIGIGDSPWRPNSASSRSACSVFVGIGRRPRALDVDDHHRQLEHHGQPRRLGLQVHPGSARPGHAGSPANAAPSATLAAAISSSACRVITLKFLRPRELVEQLGGGA